MAKTILLLILLQNLVAVSPFILHEPHYQASLARRWHSSADEPPETSEQQDTTNNPPALVSDTTWGIGRSPQTSSSIVSDTDSVKSIWDNSILIQGESLRTWSFTTNAIERVQVLMKTDGRPLNAAIDLWQGPDNTPQSMRVYVEDGNERPCSFIIQTPESCNSIAVRNHGKQEYPLTACVEAELSNAKENGSANLLNLVETLGTSTPRIVQGGAVLTKPLSPSVACVQIMLKTDGRPLSAKIELLQGPNNQKQVMEVYSEDANLRPFFALIESPGGGNVVRIVNTATIEYPLTCYAEPFRIDDDDASDAEPIGFFIVD